ncbi:hypothetical protein BJ912DRAFT_523530 [Pholiota molesta]|nr:hypothetical protein BJ912DRAFT_523530 [Pholiota molesta]
MIVIRCTASPYRRLRSCATSGSRCKSSRWRSPYAVPCLPPFTERPQPHRLTLAPQRLARTVGAARWHVCSARWARPRCVRVSSSAARASGALSVRREHRRLRTYVRSPGLISAPNGRWPRIVWLFSFSGAVWSTPVRPLFLFLSFYSSIRYGGRGCGVLVCAPSASRRSRSAPLVPLSSYAYFRIDLYLNCLATMPTHVHTCRRERRVDCYAGRLIANCRRFFSHPCLSEMRISWQLSTVG